MPFVKNKVLNLMILAAKWNKNRNFATAKCVSGRNIDADGAVN